MHHDKELNFSMIHAGLPPQWEIHQALELASEVTHILSSDDYLSFLNDMYGNKPNAWDENLTGNDRLRLIVNCFTRMRYLNDKNKLNSPRKVPQDRKAIISFPGLRLKTEKARTTKSFSDTGLRVRLGNIRDFTPYNVYPIDTGCLWDGALTALRLEDEKIYCVPSLQD